MHHIVHAATLPEAYHRALLILNDFGNTRKCPAYNTREKSISVTIDIARPLYKPGISKLIPCDPAALEQYVLEMEEGIMDFEYTVAHNWSYTYHDRMIEQLIRVCDILKKDPNSRRAVVSIRRPGDIDMEDPPCLQQIHYLINDGALDCFVVFRSNDAVKAFFMNAFALIDIQRIVSEILGVKVGRYIHTADSFHAYENDWNKLEQFTARIRNDVKGNQCSLTPELEDIWFDAMIEAIPGIRAKVNEQMKKYGMSHLGYFVGNLKDTIFKNMEG